MGSEKFCLRWNDFETNISSAFRELRDDKDFFDVTLACDDEQIQAHKVILSACSPFFRNILRRNPHQHPLLYLKGVKYTDLQSVLNFMYHGEVNVAQEELNSFLAVAEDLRVKGLTQNSSNNPKPKETYRSPPPKSPVVPTRPPDRDPLPPPKRPRPAPVAPPTQSYHHEDDDIQEVVPVKSEPRDLPLPPTPVYSAPAPIPQAAPSQMVSTEQHHDGQLQQLDDSMYGADDSYEDYGGYDTAQGYGAAGGIGDQTMDASKGVLGSTFSSPDELFQFVGKSLEKTPGVHDTFCTICQKRFPWRSAVRNHVESVHFPGMFEYPCHICNKVMSSNSSLKTHITLGHNKKN